MLTIRVFRAIDDLPSCERFAEGHGRVLEDYGVSKVTSAKNEWFSNPGVYVAAVEDEAGVMVGGLRVHMVHDGYMLPMEKAISQVDDTVFCVVASYAKPPLLSGELCGLWNAKTIAGHGVGFFLIKLGIAFAVQLGMTSLLALCSPFTVDMCKSIGFSTMTTLGNNGTFFYPKLDLVATAMAVDDLKQIHGENVESIEQINAMIAQPAGFIAEKGAKGPAEITYNILCRTAVA